MASESITISNLPDSGSIERVAYDLMARIIHAENTAKANPSDRGYYLKLYAECIQVVSNRMYGEY